MKTVKSKSIDGQVIADVQTHYQNKNEDQSSVNVSIN